jgi:hypothetical protein
MARVDLRVAAPAARILGGGCRLHERVAPIARLACSGGHRALASLGANGILLLWVCAAASSAVI